MVTRNQARIKREEEELELLLKGEVNDEEKVVESPEETTEVVQEAAKEAAEEKPLTKEEESFKKRYSDLRRHLQEKEAAWEAERKKLESGVQEVPKTEEELEDWIAKFPDLAAILKVLVIKEAKKVVAPSEETLATIKKEREELTRSRMEAEIKSAHKDFDEIKDSDEFHDWVEGQPAFIQTSVYDNTNDPKALIRVLDLYKADKKVRPKDTGAAASVAPKSNRVTMSDATQYLFSESQVSKMSAKEFADKEEEITKAIRSGKFMYDLSGSAR